MSDGRYGLPRSRRASDRVPATTLH
jgi:hypothetical protein